MPEDQKFPPHFSGFSMGKDVVSPAGDVHSISDRKTSRSRRHPALDPAFVTMGNPEEASRAIEGMNVSKRTLKIENFDVSFPVLRRGEPDVIVSVVFVDEHGARQTARLDIQKVMFLDALPEPLNREWTARVIANNIWA